MKKLIINSVLMFIILFFFSCDSGQLTKSKAQRIIEKRLNEKPFLKYSKIPGREFTVIKNRTSGINFAYKDFGVVDISLISSENMADRYSIELTNEGKKYLANNYKYNGDKGYMAIYWTHTLKEVLEIHENPSTNTAEVKVIMERSNPTPFGEASMEQFKIKSTFEETYTFKKTLDGWVWSYDYDDYMKY